MEAVFEQEYEKGEISGMYTILASPEALLEDAKKQISLMEAKLPLTEDTNDAT